MRVRWASLNSVWRSCSIYRICCKGSRIHKNTTRAAVWASCTPLHSLQVQCTATNPKVGGTNICHDGYQNCPKCEIDITPTLDGHEGMLTFSPCGTAVLNGCGLPRKSSSYGNKPLDWVGKPLKGWCIIASCTSWHNHALQPWSKRNNLIRNWTKW